MVSIRRLLQLYPPFLLLTKFSPGFFVVLQGILYQPSFSLIRLLERITHFQSKKFFSLYLLLLGFAFAVVCICVFFRVLFHFSAIMKQIGSYLHICIASYLVSDQIMWYNKRIHGHSLKITSCCCFFGF